ncbi:methylamine utilization protein [Paraglaciecola chathamensis]|uniref:methylamine utilization protein n=1 Tax=Paraglaciecola chathamensis TaxID=368405 RepID=UPI002702AD11|nr:methylamine utilization protein [Paraglaciecola chathamensis]MDO6560549.1 methylamine utilization protein [Paraglaciecola chathamensis]
MKQDLTFYAIAKRWAIKLAYICVSMAIFSAYGEESVQFKVVDQKGNPVANAVVSAKGEPKDQTAQMAVMDQVNSQFSPHVLVVQKNQSVRFPNSDDIRHHIYSFSQPKPFEIRLYKGEGSNPVTFEKPGVVVLGCNIHDQMLGYIYIAEHEITALTDENGVATLSTQANEFNIWHAKLSTSNSERVTVSRDTTASGVQQVSLSLLEEKKPEVKRRKFSRKFSPGGR